MIQIRAEVGKADAAFDGVCDQYLAACLVELNNYAVQNSCG